MSAARKSSLRWWASAIVHRLVYLAVALVLFVPVLLATIIARFVPRRRVGLGPEPLINNVHHAKALRRHGYEATTFVSHVYFITSEVDVRWLRGAPLNHYALFLFVIFRCRVLY